VCIYIYLCVCVCVGHLAIKCITRTKKLACSSVKLMQRQRNQNGGFLSYFMKTRLLVLSQRDNLPNYNVSFVLFLPKSLKRPNIFSFPLTCSTFKEVSAKEVTK
jgi:hypothetical protein